MVKKVYLVRYLGVEMGTAEVIADTPEAAAQEFHHNRVNNVHTEPTRPAIESVTELGPVEPLTKL